MDVEPLALEFFRRNVWSSFQCRHSLDQALAFRDRYDLVLDCGDELEVADEGRFVRAKFVDRDQSRMRAAWTEGRRTKVRKCRRSPMTAAA